MQKLEELLGQAGIDKNTGEVLAKANDEVTEEVLQKLAEDFPLPKVLLEYRGISKLKSTYTDKLPKMVNARTGRVHTNYAQAVAVTGREPSW